MLPTKIKTGIQGEIRELLKLFGLIVFAQGVTFRGATIIFNIHNHLIESKEACFTILTRRECMKTKKKCKKKDHSNFLGISWGNDLSFHLRN